MSATTALFVLAGAWVGAGLLVAFVMGRHGHDPFAWWLLGTVLGPLVVALATVTDVDASVEHDRQQAQASVELERQAERVRAWLSTQRRGPDEDGPRIPELLLLTGRPAEALQRLAAESGYDLLVVRTRGTGMSKLLQRITATSLAAQ